MMPNDTSAASNDSAAAQTDLLCISPHTDDAEVGLGGALRLFADRGRRVWICDLTRGELGSNATPAERWAEAAAASRELGISGRVQLDLPDGFISAEKHDQIAAVTALIRYLRPRWVVTAPDAVRHPDHVATPALVAKACFMARLARYQVAVTDATWWPDPPPIAEPTQRWEVAALFEVCRDDGRPALIFDVTETWVAKQRALACFASQFERREGRRSTVINDVSFLDKIERRGRAWGYRAGVGYGEALSSTAVPVLTDLPTESWR